MDRRNVRDAVKYGLGIAGLAEKYDCGEEAVVLRLRLIYKRDFRKIIQELRDSAKKISGINKREDTEMSDNKEITNMAISETTDETQVGEIDAGEILACNTDTAEIPDEALERNVSGDKDAAERAIADLKAQKVKLEADIAGIECDYYNTLNYREVDLKILQEKALELETIAKRFAAVRQEYTMLTEKDEKYVEILRHLRYKRLDAKRELETTEHHLRELETVTLFLYADGRIEIVDGPEFELDFSGAETNLMKLIPMPECQKLAVCEVYGLANLLAATQNSNRKTNIVFENPLAESAYTKYLGENPGKSTPSTDVVSSGDNTARQGDVA